jgi:TrmH family RNA methyltransferase
MLSKAQNKYIRSLSQQKFRNEYGVFIAEGEKICQEWLAGSGQVSMILATKEWADRHVSLVSKHPEAEFHIIKDTELAALSGLHTPNHVLLVIPVPGKKGIPVVKEWYLALDDIQDPGNMGTIIRIADWFGISNIVCSPGCVDIYNPKVVQSAMGGHLRVQVYEADLPSFLAGSALPRYAATLDGENVYTMQRHRAGVEQNR